MVPQRSIFAACLTVCVASTLVRDHVNIAAATVEWNVVNISAGVELLPAEALETSIRFVERREALGLANRLWIWPQRLNAQSTAPWGPPPYNACRFDAGTAAPAAHPGAFLVYTVLADGTIAHSEWVDTVNPPFEVLWTRASLFLEPSSALFSYGGFNVVDQASGCADDADAGFSCASCGIGICSQGFTCLQPSLRTHLFDINTLVWSHYDFNATGRGAPRNAPWLRSIPDGTFGLGLVYAYDAVREVILAVGGEQVFDGPPGGERIFAPSFEFSLQTLQWQFKETQGCATDDDCPDGFPNSGRNSIVSSRARVFDAKLRRMLVYNGIDVPAVVQDGACYTLNVDTLTWNESLSCSWSADVAPFFLFDAAVGSVPGLHLSLWVGGKLGDPGSSAVIPNQAGWMLDTLQQIWLPITVVGDADAFSAAGALPFTLHRSDLWLHSVTSDAASYSVTFLGFGGTMSNSTVDNIVYSNIVAPCTRMFGGDYHLPSLFIARPDFLHVIRLQIPMELLRSVDDAGVLAFVGLLLACVVLAVAAHVARVGSGRFRCATCPAWWRGEFFRSAAVDASVVCGLAAWLCIFRQNNCLPPASACPTWNASLGLIAVSGAATCAAHIAAIATVCRRSMHRKNVTGDASASHAQGHAHREERLRVAHALAATIMACCAPTSVMDTHVNLWMTSDSTNGMNDAHGSLPPSRRDFETSSAHEQDPGHTQESCPACAQAAAASNQRLAADRVYALTTIVLHLCGALSLLVTILVFMLLQSLNDSTAATSWTAIRVPLAVPIASTIVGCLLAIGRDCSQLARVMSGFSTAKWRHHRRLRSLRANSTFHASLLDEVELTFARAADDIAMASTASQSIEWGQ